jgi:hypothetical protein
MVMMRWKRDQRQGMLQMLILLVIGVSGLLALNQFSEKLPRQCWARPAKWATPRRVRIHPYFRGVRVQGLFARMALPRMLGDVLFAIRCHPTTITACTRSADASMAIALPRLSAALHFR